jgi:hypothetical protein
MQLTTTDLQTAFNRSQLPRQGYNFQTAIECDALRICIVRLATLSQRKLNEVKPTPPYWWLNY